MKKVSKLIVLALCVVMSMVVLSGCKDSPNEGKATPTPTQSLSTGDVITNTPKPVYMKSGDVYRYLVWNFTTDHDMLDEDGLRGDLVRDRYNTMGKSTALTFNSLYPRLTGLTAPWKPLTPVRP